jgi:hypothetical protein
VCRQMQNVRYVFDLADQACTNHTDFKPSHRIPLFTAVTRMP